MKEKCHYHSCKKKLELKKCKYCDELFCNEHITASPPSLPSFNPYNMEEKLQHEEWTKSDKHPCLPYDRVIRDEEKQEKAKQEEKLNSFLEDSKEKNKVVSKSDENWKKDDNKPRTKLFILFMIIIFILIISFFYYFWG